MLSLTISTFQRMVKVEKHVLIAKEIKMATTENDIIQDHLFDEMIYEFDESWSDLITNLATEYQLDRELVEGTMFYHLEKLLGDVVKRHKKKDAA